MLYFSVGLVNVKPVPYRCYTLTNPDQYGQQSEWTIEMEMELESLDRNNVRTDPGGSDTGWRWIPCLSINETCMILTRWSTLSSCENERMSVLCNGDRWEKQDLPCLWIWISWNGKIQDVDHTWVVAAFCYCDDHRVDEVFLTAA